MTRTLAKTKGRRAGGTFAAFPHDVLNSAAYVDLRPHAVKLLLDVAAQFRGSNNGDLSAAWGIMRTRGWRSHDTLGRACIELQDHGLIVKTRQGGRGRCSLYALTWKPIDDCKGKLDVTPTRVASNDWKEWREKIAAPIAGRTSPNFARLPGQVSGKTTRLRPPAGCISAFSPSDFARLPGTFLDIYQGDRVLLRALKRCGPRSERCYPMPAAHFARTASERAA